MLKSPWGKNQSEWLEVAGEDGGNSPSRSFAYRGLVNMATDLEGVVVQCSCAMIPKVKDEISKHQIEEFHHNI